MSPTMYQYTAMVKKLFGPYQDVKMVDDFWEVSIGQVSP